MSRAERKYQERLRAYYGKREDESGNGECFAGTYRQALGMSPLPTTTVPATPAAPVQTPLQRSIAECEAQVAKYEALSWQSAGDKEQLAFYRQLLARKLTEQAAL